MSAFRTVFVMLLALLPAAAVRGEHDIDAVPNVNDLPGSSASRPAPTLNVRVLAEIQQTLANTDPNTLAALRDALRDIAEGREARGSGAQMAMDLLNRLPGGSPASSAPPVRAAEPVAVPPVANEPAAPSKAEEAAVASQAKMDQFVDEFRELAKALAVQALAPAGIGQAGGGNAFSGDPFAGLGAGEPEPEPTRGRRGAKRPNPSPFGGAGTGGFDGEPEVAGSGGGYGGGGTISTGYLYTGSSRKQLAGAISGFLSRFQARLSAKAPAPASRPGVFGRLAGRLAQGVGLTPERAVAMEARSAPFKVFRQVTQQAGFTGPQSLGAYYTVLGAAWLGTLLFALYLFRHTRWIAPLWARLGRPLARARGGDASHAPQDGLTAGTGRLPRDPRSTSPRQARLR